MLVSEVIALAEQQTDEEYTETEWLRYINACLDDLTPVAKRLKQKSGIAVTPSGGAVTITIADAVSAPANLAVTPTGGTATTWGYRVSAITASGESTACTQVTTAVGAATLSGPAACNKLTWDAVAGATGYKVYRTTAGGTPSTTGLLATVTDEQFIDGGGAADGSAVPSADSSGDLKKAYEFLRAFYTPSGGTKKELRRLPLGDNTNEGWKLIDGSILLQAVSGASGTVDMDFYQKLTHAAETTDDLEATLGLPEAYHYLVVLYCTAKSQSQEEELEDKNDAYNEYLAGKRVMAADRIWQMEPENRHLIKKARLGV